MPIESLIQNLSKYCELEKVEIFDLDSVQKFISFLNQYNEIGGFFSKRDTNFIFPRHVLESLLTITTITKTITVSRETKLMDAGTGPGLPGYLFSCLKQPPFVTLLDSQRRKMQYLEKMVKDESNDKKIEFKYERIEDFHDKFQIITMRSAIPYPWSLEMISKNVKEGGYFIPFLGKENSFKDLESVMLMKFGFKIQEEILIEDLKFLGERRLKFLKKERNVMEVKSRAWKELKKEIEHYNGKSNINQ